MKTATYRKCFCELLLTSSDGEKAIIKVPLELRRLARPGEQPDDGVREVKFSELENIAETEQPSSAFTPGEQRLLDIIAKEGQIVCLHALDQGLVSSLVSIITKLNKA